MKNIGETLVLGVDISDTGESTLMVYRRHGRGLTFIKRVAGKEAEDLYEQLTNKKEETK